MTFEIFLFLSEGITNSSVGAIVGGIFGAILLISIIGVLVYLAIRKRKENQTRIQEMGDNPREGMFC